MSVWEITLMNVYTYNDDYMRYFVRKIRKGGRCSSLNQYYKSINSDEVFSFISRGLNPNGNICEISVKNFNIINKQRKLIENDHDSQFEDSGKIDSHEKAKHINNEVSKLAKDGKLKILNFDKVMMDFDAFTLYPSADWDANSVFPEIQSGIAFKPHMENIYVKAFNFQTFNQNGKERAIF